MALPDRRASTSKHWATGVCDPLYPLSLLLADAAPRQETAVVLFQVHKTQQVCGRRRCCSGDRAGRTLRGISGAVAGQAPPSRRRNFDNGVRRRWGGSVGGCPSRRQPGPAPVSRHRPRLGHSKQGESPAPTSSLSNQLRQSMLPPHALSRLQDEYEALSQSMKIDELDGRVKVRVSLRVAAAVH